MKQIFSIHKWIMLGVCAGLFCSCSSPPKLILYNNTGSAIRVVSAGKEITIAAFEQKDIPFPAHTRKMTILFNTTKWRYHINYPPKEYCKPTACTRIKAQIEKDGSIYIGLPSLKLPFSSLPIQPDSFPLMPKNGSTNES